VLKINNQYLLTFVYEETLNCLKSHKNKRIKINMQYYLNDKKLNKIEKQREIENEAINLVIKKYGKGLENRLKGTGVTPSYRSWYENDCFVSIAAGTYQEDTWSAMKWFSVNVCSESAEIMESE